MGSVAWQYNNDFQKILQTVKGATGTGYTVITNTAGELVTAFPGLP